MTNVTVAAEGSVAHRHLVEMRSCRSREEPGGAGRSREPGGAGAGAGKSLSARQTERSATALLPSPGSAAHRQGSAAHRNRCENRSGGLMYDAKIDRAASSKGHSQLSTSGLSISGYIYFQPVSSARVKVWFSAQPAGATTPPTAERCEHSAQLLSVFFVNGK